MAFLVSRDIQRGYVIVSCRQHVVEPFGLPDDKGAAYWADILRVGGVVHTVYAPKSRTMRRGRTTNRTSTLTVPRYELDPHD